MDVLRLPVVVPRWEVLRYLGYPRSRTPSAVVVQRLDALWTRAEGLIEAQGAFVVTGRKEAERVGVPRATDRVGLAACTIGPGIEEEEKRLSDEGDALGALLLDSFGSAAAEAAADALHARICAAVQVEDWTATRRVSPGYGQWNVQRQAELLAWLPIDRMGMRLTEGSMMVPRKSVSFAVMLVEGKPASARHRCAACDLLDCRYRREGAAGESPHPKESKPT